MSTPRACLIDSSIYIFRAWFSLPDRWHTANGYPLNAVYGYSSFLLDLIQTGRVQRHCAAAFDESLGSCYRNEILPGYKSSRELPDEALAFQLEACRELTERLGIPSFGGELYEADDYIATLARMFRELDIPVTIVTRDKDLGQLLTHPGDRWFDFAAGVTLDAAGFEDKHGVEPARFADYLALVGDKIDDIPGVPGVGPKTAAALIGHFGSLEQLEARLGEVADLSIRGAAGVAKRLLEHWPQVRLARQLTGLQDQIPEINRLPTYQPSRAGLEALGNYLQELGLGGPLVARCQRMAEGL